jgi:mRNA-degrading endonuclease RelE of RelBE toxin-antitoxin system
MSKRSVGFSSMFIKRIKELKKKYPNVKKDADVLADILEQGATPGDRLQGMGDYVVYKTRIASRDMQRGKSGGFRVVYYLHTETHSILITIYAKAEQDDIETELVLASVRQAIEELENNISDESDDSSE